MENDKPQKTCLLIIPVSFYSYSKYFKESLQRSCYDVTVINDEYPANTIGKIMGKLRIPYLQRLTSQTIKNRFLDGKSYDMVLIVKGRGMSEQLINDIRQISPKVVGYSFDSFKYHIAPLAWYKCLNKFCTFDYRDGNNHKIPVVELFSSMPEKKEPKEYTYEISAIIRNHSDRLKFVDKVFSNLLVKNKFIFIYEQNIMTFLINFIKSPVLYLKYRKNISFKSLPYSEYAQILQNSNFTLDFAHPSQSGITIRCFEALSSATKIITNNPFITRYKHFTEENTIITNNNTFDSDYLRNHYAKIKHKTPQKHNRTIDCFMQELLQ